MKKLTLITLIFSIANLYSQQLTSTTFDLNSGGYVNDVAYSEAIDAYIVVGEFSSINGRPRHNFALIDGSLNTILDTNFISNSDGIFQTVTTHNNRIFIGGNFSTIEITSSLILNRNGLIILEYTNGIFSVSNIDLGISSTTDPYGTKGLYDLEISGDSLFIAGSFATNTPPFNNNIVCYNANDLTQYQSFTNSNSGSINPIYDIEKIGDKLYSSGYQLNPNNSAIIRFDQNGSPDPNFQPNPTSANSPVSLYYFFSHIQNSAYLLCAAKHNSYNLLTKIDTSGLPTNTPIFPILPGGLMEIQTYKSLLFRSQSGCSDFHTYQYHNNTLSLISTFNQNQTAFNQRDHFKRDLNIAQNYLFISSSQLNSFDNQTRNGLAILCLEPDYMTTFTQYEDQACTGYSIDFVIDSVKYAKGYNWKYTGHGAEINNQSIENTNGVDFWGEDKNAITINFPNNFSPGYLIVRAFSDCGEKTKDSLAIFIDQRPIPQFQALSDSSITCSKDSILLTTSIYTPNTTAFWLDFQNNTTPDDSIIATNPGEYKFILTDTFGCQNIDTSTITIDTTTPNHQASAYYAEINCLDSSIILTTFSTTPNTLSYWNTTNHDSLTINTPGTFTSITVDSTNGCKDSSYTITQLNYNPPNFQIDGYDSIPLNTPLDYLNCQETSILLTPIADSNHITYWTDSSGTTFSNDTLISSATSILLYSKNTSSGCDGIKNIIIDIDTIPPVFLTEDTLNINCSVDSVELDAEIFTINNISYWTNEVNDTIENNTYTDNPGQYNFYIEDTINKCSNNSTIHIIQEPDILFNSNSMIICNESENLIYTFPSYDETLNYQWFNGTTDSSITIFDLAQNPVSVVVYDNDSTCYGTNHIFLEEAPRPIDDFQIFKPCNEDATGSITAAVSGGLPPFQYSLYDTLFQSFSNHFDSLSEGPYSV